ncbi:hypothetical protein SPRG_09411 [Saprolegnia parasitica CBS 223.65]|uniref:Uncharacterized protein n=1 Tax=Saprolegnia parasitica (strain CBS 223.65) TaxID=695850 RepID=A0A067C4K9_SAPPC|nr:hypothetical protein SPRG_09411 [Saprolegnia parasitica CBS 223.65]KDO25468.1 hypothetical protein SPRG_09411 [Saprolegnia parasitica CBS 223.65]|eukprot:XP_012203893.1 hypothetical protein SPRG_09411 [Saprolegnia parasitica CBS 223.65]
MAPKTLARNEELLDEMTSYSLGNYVKDMMAILLERLIVDQPNDPLNYLINLVQNDPAIIALDDEARYSRMDLRTIKTKQKLLKTIYDDLRTYDKAAFLSAILASKLLRQHFPRHANDIVNAVVQTEKVLPPKVTLRDLSTLALAVLARPAST